MQVQVGQDFCERRVDERDEGERLWKRPDADGILDVDGVQGVILLYYVRYVVD